MSLCESIKWILVHFEIIFDKKSIQTHLKTQKIKARNPRWEMAQLLQFALHFCLATWTLCHFALPMMMNCQNIKTLKL